jgi:hypothetical protein
MKRIKATPNAHSWPRQAVSTIETRKRDLVVRIADWTRDKDSPCFDVEVYIGGVYDWNESKSFEVGTYSHCFPSRCTAKARAAEFAASQIKKLL